MARSPKSPDHLANALRQVLQRIDPDRRLPAYRAWALWADVVGTTVAAHAEPAAFRDGVLSVRVGGSAWMQELQLMKDTLRERLNERLGAALIRDIYFVSGAVAAPPPRARVRTARVQPAIELPQLRDPQLAAIIERLARAARARGRS
ncbi:MAG: DciA family protein [Candidatus Binatia bacterium]